MIAIACYIVGGAIADLLFAIAVGKLLKARGE